MRKGARVKGECWLTRRRSRAKGHRVGLRGSGDALLLAACVNEEAHVATQHPCCNTAHRVATTKERTAKTARHSNASKYLRRRPSPSAIAVVHRRRPSPPRRSTRPIDAALRADAHFALTGNWPIRDQPEWECESENGRSARLPWSMQHARASRASRSHSPASACADGWSDASARSTRARLGCNMAQHGATQYNMAQHSTTWRNTVERAPNAARSR